MLTPPWCPRRYSIDGAPVQLQFRQRQRAHGLFGHRHLGAAQNSSSFIEDHHRIHLIFVLHGADRQPVDPLVFHRQVLAHHHPAMAFAAGHQLGGYLPRSAAAKPWSPWRLSGGRPAHRLTARPWLLVSRHRSCRCLASRRGTAPR